MATLKEIDGDLTTFEDWNLIFHQCNCLTVYAAGTAKNIFDKHPWSDIYSCRPKNVDHKNLPIEQWPGHNIIRRHPENSLYVVNMLAQVFPGKPKFPDSKFDGTQARIKYFKECLSRFKNIRFEGNLAFPYKIGCNLGGGNWEDYYGMIKEFSSSLPDGKKLYVVNYNGR